MTTVLDDLHALDELFSDASKWTQGALAKTQEGETVAPIDPRAVCWCLYGGMLKVTGRYRDAIDAYAAIQSLPSVKGTVSHWNDEQGRQFVDVKGVIRTAIRVSELAREGSDL